MRLILQTILNMLWKISNQSFEKTNFEGSNNFSVCVAMKTSGSKVEASGPPGLAAFQRFTASYEPTEVMRDDAQAPTELSYLDDSLQMAEILSRRSTVGAFANGQKSLVQRLEKDFEQVLTIFKEYESQRTIFIIGELFMSVNTVLLEKVAEDSQVMNAFVEVISQGESELDLFRIGITARIIASALEVWPQKVFEQIFLAENMLSALLERDSVSTRWLLETITRACDETTSSFLWGFFVALFDGSVSAAPPSHWDLSSDSFFICADMKLNCSQRIEVYRLFAMFLNRLGSTATGEQLKEDLFVSIPELLPIADIVERGEILALAAMLPHSAFFIDLAFEVLDVDLQSRAAETALGYLTVNHELVPVGKAIYLFQRLLKPPAESWGEKNSFVTGAAWNLMEQLRSKSPHKKFFTKAMEHIIAYAWNRRPPRERISCNACLLGYSLPFLHRASWRNWFDFCNFVVRNFRDQTRWNDAFVFNEDAWDKELMDQILSGAKEFDLPPEDSIVFIRMKSSASATDNLSESASKPSQQAFAPKPVRASPRGVRVKPRAHTPGPPAHW